MMKERRKFVRLDATIDVKYKILKRGKKGKMSRSSKNISGGGIRLDVNEEISVASILQLEIKIPVYSEPILAEGIVAWTKSSELGIEFTRINPIDRTRIFKYVYEHIY